MKCNREWKDYQIIATGDGMKLERWGRHHLLRPDPQVIWPASIDLYGYRALDGVYRRSKTGGGAWEMRKSVPQEFTVGWRDLKFSLKLMGFKHTGLFPEQAVNWSTMIDLIKARGGAPTVLNLFGYTGGSTVACTSAGAFVTHVDAAKAMVERCKDNMRLSGLAEKPVRYIVDDCVRFVEKEIRRGKKYDAIIMDPPSYGRGPSGEMWKIEENLYPLLELCSQILTDNPLFFLINSYTTGLQPTVIRNMLTRIMKNHAGSVEAYEVGLPTDEEDIILPCGASAIWKK